MMNHKRYFNGGINADSDFELVEPNQWVNASNIRTFSTDSGANNIIESVGGTSVVFNSLPAGTNFCMGGCEDEQNGWIVWFNFNSNNLHGIYCYVKATGITYTVVLANQTTGALSLSKDRYIHSCSVTNGILYWTDIAAYRINIKAGINMNFAGTFPSAPTYINPIKDTTISLIKKPPTFKPEAFYAQASPAITFNLVKNKPVRFAYRYNFIDNEESVLSPWSNVVDTRGDQGVSNNSITVKIHAQADPIEQDVQSVDLVIQYTNTNKAFVVKSWDKRIASEATEINNANILISSPLTYSYKNDQAGITLDDVYVAKPFENIPISTKTLALAKNRLFLANYTTGYNAPLQTSLTYTGGAGSPMSAFLKIFKTDTSYDTGVIFKDKYGRKSGVVKGPRVSTTDMAYYAVDPSPAPSRNITLAFTLSNTQNLIEIPDWAFSYSVVRSAGLRTPFFIQGHTSAGQFKYVYKNATTGVLSYSDTITTPPYGLALDISETIAAGIGYSFTEGSGDQIKVFTSTGFSITTEIIAAESVYVIIPWQSAPTGSLTTTECVFEIYQIPKNSVDTIYYEVGAEFPITNPTLSTRAYSNLNISLTGDSWAVLRKTATSSIYVEAMSPNDSFWQEWAKDETRPNQIDRIGQKNIGTGILYSNVLIPGTRVNGLSSFEALNETILDQENGPISKLELTSKIQEDGTVMLAICTQETVSCYLGEQELFDANGSQFVARANNVIGNTKALQGSMGTQNPESVVLNNGLVWWWDIRNGCAVQYSGNGLFPVTKNLFTRPANLFSKKFASLSVAQIEALGSRPFIVGGYDPHHKELLFTIPSTEVAPKGNLTDYTNFIYPYDIYDGQGKTLMYKTEADRFIGSMPIQAEKFIRLGNDLYGFKNGALYIFNQPSNGLLFGTQYTAKLMFANNPKGINSYLTVGLQANKKPQFVHLRTEDPYIQSSDLVASDFTTKEGVQYASLLRDRLSPNHTGNFIQKQMIGDKLFGKALLTMLEFDVTTPLKLKFTDFGHYLNTGHNI